MKVVTRRRIIDQQPAEERPDATEFTKEGLKRRFERFGKEADMLLELLANEDYALGLSPGFFCFYAHIGILHALEDKGCLRPTQVTGSSAGALVGSFLSAGMTPSQMIEYVLTIQREHIWDIGGIGGLLKGTLFQQLIEGYLPVKTFEECKIPLAVTAYDLVRFRTNCITTGNIATAVRASCTFPGLFQPVMIDGSPHIDGGVFDDSGLMSMPHCIASRDTTNNSSNKESSDSDNSDAANRSEKRKLVVNIVCGRGRLNSSYLPEPLKDSRLLTIVLDNIPMVTPFTMDSAGPAAYHIARQATLRALESSHMQELDSNHWCCYVDGNDVPAALRDPATTNSTNSSGDSDSDNKIASSTAEQSSANGGSDNVIVATKSSGVTATTTTTTTACALHGHSQVEIMRVPSLPFITTSEGVYHCQCPVATLAAHPDEHSIAAIRRLNSSSCSQLSLTCFADSRSSKSGSGSGGDAHVTSFTSSMSVLAAEVSMVEEAEAQEGAEGTEEDASPCTPSAVAAAAVVGDGLDGTVALTASTTAVAEDSAEDKPVVKRRKSRVTTTSSLDTTFTVTGDADGGGGSVITTRSAYRNRVSTEEL